MVTVTTVGMTHPTVSGSGGSAAAPATCGFVSEPTHPYAGYLVGSPTITIVNPEIHDKPTLDNQWEMGQTRLEGELMDQSISFVARASCHSMGEVRWL